MDRRVIAGLLGLYLTGCAQARTGLPEAARPTSSNTLGGMTPIKESINRGLDPETKRASVAPEPAVPAEIGPPPIPDSSPTAPSGRPAPFAGQTSALERPQSARTDPPDAIGRPAPYAEQAPARPRPQSPGPRTEVTPPQAIGGVPLRPEPQVAAAPAESPKRDPEVERTSGATPLRPAAEKSRPLGGAAATVGNEIITLTQLRAALKDQLERVPEQERNDPRIQRALVDRVLNQLIERTLLVQAAKRQMKDPKALEQFFGAVDKAWLEHEMPPLLRETKTGNVFELKQKLSERGVSLDQIREDFRLNALAREYMMMKLQPKMTVSLPEKQKYYSAHTDDFKRPAQIVWREIVIETSKCATRDEARLKAGGLLQRVVKGEDFAKLAKAESHGATARDGGKWEIAPGSYAVPEVNAALERLPAGGLSSVIEAASSFHIVKVESKREAGPARFDEVQDEVHELVMRQKQANLAGQFIDNIRAKTLVKTMFDAPTLDPSAVKTSDAKPAGSK